MAITQITEPAAQLAQVTAVVVGGCWAYAKFARGRTFHYRGTLSLEVALFSHDGRHVLGVEASMRNDGLSHIPLHGKMLSVDALRTDRVEARAAVEWEEDVLVARLFEEQEALEPGEDVNEELLVPLPLALGQGVAAYRVRAAVAARRRLPVRRPISMWSANFVVPVDLENLWSRERAASARG